MAENQLQHLLALGAGTAFQFVLGSISPPKDLSKPSGRNMVVCDNEMLAGGRIPSSVLAASPPAHPPLDGQGAFPSPTSGGNPNSSAAPAAAPLAVK